MENNALFKLVLSDRAKQELLQAYNWYEDQQLGLGDRFRATALDRINKILQNPELFSTKHGLFREVRVAVFPYVIVYKINKKKKRIVITSVFHTSLNPAKKYK